MAKRRLTRSVVLLGDLILIFDVQKIGSAADRAKSPQIEYFIGLKRPQSMITGRYCFYLNSLLRQIVKEKDNLSPSRMTRNLVNLLLQVANKL